MEGEERDKKDKSNTFFQLVAKLLAVGLTNAATDNILAPLTLRFDYFVPQQPVSEEVTGTRAYEVSSLGGVCVHDPSGGGSPSPCDVMFFHLYSKLTSTLPPNLVASPTVIQNGHDYTDRAVIMNAEGWGEVVRDANERGFRKWERTRKR